ncbi:hypothetical protein [Conexibacter woesei]|uniref:hypothetical protein n=1 Tax=Conexibacter woesei TaxID=191495 RepID=UPI0004097D90|nr:hypothetical protein [Conexibacter woesei]
MLHRSRIARAALAALALPLLLGGLLAVGAFTDDRSAAGDELRARADAVCLRAHDRLAGLDPLDSPDTVARSGPQVVAATLDAARRLLALRVNDDIRRYAQHLIRQADLAGRLQDAARAGDRARAVALIRALAANSRAGKAIGARISPGCGGSTRPAAPAATPDPTTSI